MEKKRNSRSESSGRTRVASRGRKRSNPARSKFAPKRAERAARESEKRLAGELAATRWLQQVSTELIQERNVEALYGKLLDAAVALMDSDAASMHRFYQDQGPTGELALLSHRGFDPATAESFQRVRVHTGCACAEALRTGRRVVIEDVEKCAFICNTPGLEAYRRSGIRAVQSTPLISRCGQVLGMICTHWRQPHRPAEQNLRLMDVLARQAADLIERSRVETMLRESEEQFHRLFEDDLTGDFVSTPQGEILLCNPAFARIFGFAHAVDAVDLTERLKPDVAVMDVSMPLMSGDEATQQIKQRRPDTRVVALSMAEDAGTAERMRAAGAEAYVLKTAPAEELLAAIRGA